MATTFVNFAAASAKVCPSILEQHNFIDQPWDGHNKIPELGVPFAAITKDLIKAIKKAAGPAASVMNSTRHIYMEQEILDRLIAQKVALSAQPGVLSTADTSAIIRISDAEQKAENQRVEDNEKATICLDILHTFISPSMRTHIQPIKDEHGENYKLALNSITDDFEEHFLAPAVTCKLVIQKKIDTFGIATTQAEVTTLLTALLYQQARMINTLYKDSEKPAQRLLSIQADNLLIIQHNALTAAYHGGNVALPAGQYMLPIPELVLSTELSTEGIKALARHNLRVENYCRDSDNYAMVPLVGPAYVRAPDAYTQPPPKTELYDPAVLPKSDEDWNQELLNRIESSPTSAVVLPRQLLLKIMERTPIPPLAQTGKELSSLMAKNTDSNNHVLHQLMQASLAKSTQAAAARGGPTRNVRAASATTFTAEEIIQNWQDQQTQSQQEVAVLANAATYQPHTYTTSDSSYLGGSHSSASRQEGAMASAASAYPTLPPQMPRENKRNHEAMSGSFPMQRGATEPACWYWGPDQFGNMHCTRAQKTGSCPRSNLHYPNIDRPPLVWENRNPGVGYGGGPSSSSIYGGGSSSSSSSHGTGPTGSLGQGLPRP